MTIRKLCKDGYYRKFKYKSSFYFSWYVCQHCKEDVGTYDVENYGLHTCMAGKRWAMTSKVEIGIAKIIRTICKARLKEIG